MKLQRFTGGTIFYSAGTGADSLSGEVLARYEANGGVRGQIGVPLSSMTQAGDGRGVWARFEGGNIYDSDATAAHEVSGGVLTKYLAAGRPTGPLACATSELDPPGTEGGRIQQFEGGVITYP
jgi:uncharacterized protein with LGFP repeats